MVNKTVFALRRAFSHVESMKDHLCRGRLYNTIHQAWTTANCVTASLRTWPLALRFWQKWRVASPTLECFTRLLRGLCQSEMQKDYLRLDLWRHKLSKVWGMKVLKKACFSEVMFFFKSFRHRVILRSKFTKCWENQIMGIKGKKILWGDLEKSFRPKCNLNK